MIDLSTVEFNPLPKELRGLTLWRYMSIEELKGIFENKAFGLTPALRFPDPFEGHIPLKQAKQWERRIWSLPDTAEINEDYVKYYLECVKRNTFIKCFHNAETESEQMWRLYARNGVAIKIGSSEIGRPVYWRSDHGIHFDVIQVSYVSSVTDDAPFMEPRTMYHFKKKDLYEHESEIRIIGTNIKKTIDEHNSIVGNFAKTGRWHSSGPLVSDAHPLIPIEPNYVIQSIVVSPFGANKVLNDVLDLVECFEFRNEVKRSNLKSLK